MRFLFASQKKLQHVCLNLMIFNFDLNGDNYQIFEVNELRLPFNEVFIGGNIIDLQTDQTGDKALLIALGVHYANSSTRSYDKKKYACKITHALHLTDGMIVPFIEPIVEVKPKDEDKEDTGLSWVVGGLRHY
jgi:hypothetical protein